MKNTVALDYPPLVTIRQHTVTSSNPRPAYLRHLRDVLCHSDVDIAVTNICIIDGDWESTHLDRVNN